MTKLDEITITKYETEFVAKQQLDKLAVYLLAPKEEANVQLDYDEIASILRDVKQDLTELEALKKPPTVDEVCKALSEYEKRNVVYSDKTHEFYYLEYEGKIGEYQQFITETYGDGLWSLGVYLPPHLITLIGRFYEGLEVEE